MATVSLPRSHRWPIVSTFISAWRRWQMRRVRGCVCQSFRAEPELDPADYIARGQHRAAVFMARLQLENEIGRLVGQSKSIRKDKIQIRTTPPLQRVTYLVKRGCFDPEFQQKFLIAYGRASRVIHGQHCPKDRAVSIVNQVRGVLAASALYEKPFPKECFQPLAPESTPRKVIAGFAAMDQRWMERTSDDQLMIDERVGSNV
jgi:hypothetical protein